MPSVDLTLLPTPVRLTQLEFLHLAGRSPGNAVTKLDRRRCLVPREPGPAVTDELLLGGVVPVGQPPQRFDGPPPLVGRHTDHGAPPYGRMAEQPVPPLDRRHVLPAGDDHVLL